MNPDRACLKLDYQHGLKVRNENPVRTVKERLEAVMRQKGFNNHRGRLKST